MRFALRRNVRQLCVCWICYALAWLLLSHPSAATFNPLYNPQHHYYHEQNPEYYTPEQQPQGATTVPDPRGGSTLVAAEPVPEEQPFHPPKIMLKHMSMALRLTSEWNRRLIAGVNRIFGAKKKIPEQDSNPSSFGRQPININPTRSWHPPIQESSQQQNEEDELTIFHAKTPRPSEDDEVRRGVARWGPELLPYLEHVVKLLGISANGVEIALAMIYLDRACSLETVRTSGCPPCPFCMPRTVHRLSLVALLLATQAIQGDTKTISEYIQDLESLGIPSQQLEQMADWMRYALGDEGLFVTVGQMKVWSQTWDSIFFPKQQQQQIMAQQQQQAQPMQIQGPTHQT